MSDWQDAAFCIVAWLILFVICLEGVSYMGWW